MNGRRIVWIVVILLILVFIAQNEATSNTVLGSMGDTLTRWIGDIYRFLTGATHTHP